MYTSFFRKAMLGDTATLNLDFTTGVLDSRLTFTRAANTATYINSSGYVTTATANTPRFDYDPVTLAPRGLLIEGSAVNLATNSTFSSGWSGGVNVTVSANTLDVLDPAGTNTATKCTLTNSTYASKFESFSGLAASTTYTWSYWIRGTAGNQQRIYSATTGTDLVTQSAYTYSTSGWTRVTTTFTTTAVVTQAYVYPISKNTGTGDVIYIWGAQLELGSGASSYIPTGASQVTRNADNCELLDLTTMAFNASAGTIYTDVGVRLNTGSTRNYTFLPASGSNNQIFEGSGTAFNVYSSGSFVVQIGTSNVSSQKIAAAYALNDYAVSVAGGAASTDTSGAVPTSLTKLTIGGSVINSASYMNGCIRVFKYYPTRLTNAQLQALTAP